MSNVKRITINGKLPYDCADHPDMLRYLAQLNAPGLGLRIRYSETTTLVPNRDVKRTGMPTADESPEDGKTTFYGYCIHGEEAVSWGWIDCLKAAIVACGGTVDGHDVIDLEA